MKLYYSPGACSLSPHIVALEANIELQLEKVDLDTKTLDDGRGYLAINPKGYVPALELDDGTLLTEGVVVALYLADRKPTTGLAPGNNSMARYRFLETLIFITSEIHKGYSPLFNSATPASVRESNVATLRQRYGLIEEQLQGRNYLFGDHFTVADAYLFTVTTWADVLKIDLSEFANLAQFQKLVGSRPAVRAALRAEGLL